MKNLCLILEHPLHRELISHLRSKSTPLETGAPPMENFSLKSQMLQQGETIPTKYTCDGKWHLFTSLMGTPSGNGKVASINCWWSWCPRGCIHALDSVNLSTNIRSLPEGVPKLDRLNGGGIHGKNSFNEKGYNGPCPPPGKPPHLQVHPLCIGYGTEPETRSTKEEVLKAMEGHVLTRIELMGSYGRS